MVTSTSTSTSKPFTHLTNESAFTRRHHNHIHTTTVHHLHPPQSHSSSSSSSSSSHPWITACETTPNHTVIFRHPLTSKPYSFTPPPNFNFAKLHPSTLAVSYHLPSPYSVDTLLKLNDSYELSYSSLLALYGGGQLQACPRYAPEEGSVAGTMPWVKISPYFNFDDIIIFDGKVYAVDRQGWVVVIHNYKTIKKFKIRRSIMSTVTPGAGGFGWRKRLVIDGGSLYMVVRDEEKSFRVYLLKKRGKTPRKGFVWVRVDEFKGEKVLFMGRDCYFFRKASRKFPGREYRNCIVFSEAAFPQYGIDCWEFTQCGDRQLSEDDIGVFRFGDRVFAREGEGVNSVFPKIDWSPPAWIFDVSAFSADEFRKHSVSECSSQSEREPVVDRGLDSDNRKKNDGEVQSDLKDTVSKDGEEQEEMVTDFSSQDEVDEGVESDSDSHDQEDEKMQRDSNNQENEEEEMHTEANLEGDGSLQEDAVSVDPIVESIRRAFHSGTSRNGVVEQETSGKNITSSIHKASVSSTTESHKSDTATIKFEGLDIRSDFVPSLQKIWRKHGNIIKDSILRSGDIVARALESLATMVQILENNPVLSLSDSQADYISSTLSDLKNIRFNVNWLVSFVEKAIKVHNNKSSVEALNNLSQLSSKVKERRAILLEELAKFNEQENKLKEEIGKVSKMLPFSGPVKFDEPIGAGLT
ncbi:uncharacterized protein LOC141610874 [Silene latifolia]|uniref:uncharacterized protein LOC141610874 n=1 Tax=Silene latifolia TaxID=37657 RepID=UPI003D7732E9